MHPRYLILSVSALALVAIATGCRKDGSSPSPTNPGEIELPGPTPGNQPSPKPTSAACQLTAPTVDCATRKVSNPDLANDLQEAIDVAIGAPGAMAGQRIFDLDLFREKLVDNLSAKGICGAWDYGNEKGDEIFVRSADGCVVEQYDLITGSGEVRTANRQSLRWQEGFGVPVPGPKPSFPKYGDISCSLPGDRSTFCYGIKGTSGQFGAEVKSLIDAVISENPTLVDRNDYLSGQDHAANLGLKINNVDGYIQAIEKKLRSNGFCAHIEKGDILMVKSLDEGNIFHEEFDVVLEPGSGKSYTGFVAKDRCHNAGF